MCCDWPLGGLAVALLLSGTSRLQTNTSVENVLTSMAAPIRHWGFVCVRRQAVEGGEQCLLVEGGGAGGVLVLATGPSSSSSSSWLCQIKVI